MRLAAGIAAGVSREDTNVINDCCQLGFCLCLGWMETRALLPHVVPAPRCLMDITYLYLHLEGGGRHNCFAGIYQIGQKEAVPINRKHHRALLWAPGRPLCRCCCCVASLLLMCGLCELDLCEPPERCGKGEYVWVDVKVNCTSIRVALEQQDGRGSAWSTVRFLQGLPWVLSCRLDILHA